MPHRHHVLLVEDHDDTREALQMALDVLGVRVFSADNGRDGLAALRAGGDFCVVLLDWRMPEMGGEAFLSARIDDAALCRAPVIAVTGDGLQPERGADLGIREVIRKPVDPVEVLRAVGRHCPHAADAG